MKKYVLISFFNGDATGVRVFSTREKLSNEFKKLAGYSYDEHDEYIASTFEPDFDPMNMYLCFEAEEE